MGKSAAGRQWVSSTLTLHVYAPGARSSTAEYSPALVSPSGCGCLQCDGSPKSSTLRPGSPRKRISISTLSVEIEIRFRGEPGRRVELFGEPSHWRQPHPLGETSAGEYSAVLDLAPGAYTCKVRVDDTHWRPAADLPIDHSEGLANSTLIVAGTRAPVYFAPSRRCWFMTSERTLELRFEIESGTEVPTFELLTSSEVVCGQLTP